MSIKNKRLKVGDLIVVYTENQDKAYKVGIVVKTHRKKRRRLAWPQAVIDGKIRLVGYDPPSQIPLDLPRIEKVVTAYGGTRSESED